MKLNNYFINKKLGEEIMSLNNNQIKNKGRRNFLKKSLYTVAGLSLPYVLQSCVSGNRTVSNQNSSPRTYYPGSDNFLNKKNLKRILNKYSFNNPNNKQGESIIDGKDMVRDISGSNVYSIDTVINDNNIEEVFGGFVQKIPTDEVSMMIFYDPRATTSNRTVLGAMHAAAQNDIKLGAVSMYLFREPLNTDGYSDDFLAKNTMMSLLFEDKNDYWNKDLKKLLNKEDFVENHLDRPILPLTLIFDGRSNVEYDTVFPIDAYYGGADLNNDEIITIAAINDAMIKDVKKNYEDISKREFQILGENIGTFYTKNKQIRDADKLYRKQNL
jgi:hypothetical protein